MSHTSEPTRKHPLASCERCPLLHEKCAPSTGPAGAKIAVVSRSPGYYDVQNDKPFTGPSGKVLDHLLEQNGVKRDEVLVTNVVLCQTEKPPKEAIEACSLRLKTEINASEIVIACGPEAAKALTGASSVMAARGYTHKRDNFSGNVQRVVVTNNPALVLRSSESFPDLVRDFRRALNPPPPPTYPDTQWTNSIRQAKMWAEKIWNMPATRFACDIETRGLSHTAPLVCVGFSATGQKAVTFGESVVNDYEFRNNMLRPLLTRKNTAYVWHNGKFDTRNLIAKGVRARCDEDTLLLSYCLDERPGTHSLDYLLMEYLGWGNYEPPSVKKFKRAVMNAEKQGKDVMEIEYDEDDLYTYNAWDTAGTAQLYDLLSPQMDDDNWRVYRELLIPASAALVRSELYGFPYDIDRACDIHEEEIIPLLTAWKKQLQNMTGIPTYNPMSPTQTSKLIYSEWGVELDNKAISGRRDKEFSVDEPVYTEIAAGRFKTNSLGAGESRKPPRAREPIIIFARRFRDYKQLAKQGSTYIESLVAKAERSNGRIHTSFKLHGTSSGRLSSENPNIQNITRPKPGLPNIRSLFNASEGRILLQADYSQAEMRAIAIFSQDANLLAIYDSGISLHKQAAARFYGEDYTKEQYSNTKNMNFGVAYGQTAMTFQEKHDIPEEEAAEFIKWWWSEFPGVKAWIAEVHRQALRENILVSPFGRKRRIHLITKENRGEILRESVNFYPQSTAHDFTLWSLIQLDHMLDPRVAAILLDGHDSLVLDVVESYAEEVAETVRTVMQSAARESIGWDRIPFSVEIGFGPSWGEIVERETQASSSTELPTVRT